MNLYGYLIKVGQQEKEISNHKIKVYPSENVKHNPSEYLLAGQVLLIIAFENLI